MGELSLSIFCYGDQIILKSITTIDWSAAIEIHLTWEFLTLYVLFYLVNLGSKD